MYYVINKVSGMALRSFAKREDADNFAGRCNQSNNTDRNIVCELRGGVMYEL